MSTTAERRIETTRRGSTVYHRAEDGEALPNQPNATFAHGEGWSAHCTFCLGRLSMACLEGLCGRCRGLASPAIYCGHACHGGIFE